MGKRLSVPVQSSPDAHPAWALPGAKAAGARCWTPFPF